MQSPAGVGIAGAIYDYDGNVYVSDEARMMARFKNYYFRLGNVNENTYQEMFNGELLHHIIASACNECLPVCAECVFQPYCGADPVCAGAGRDRRTPYRGYGQGGHCVRKQKPLYTTCLIYCKSMTLK